MRHCPRLLGETMPALGMALGLIGLSGLPLPGYSQEVGTQDSLAPMTAIEFTGGDPLAAWARGRLADIGSAAGPGGADLRLRLERIRAMYFLSVEEKDWANRTKDSLRAIRDDIPEGTEESVTYRAYRGALEVVRAKHARWPGNKLNHLERGTEILDGLIEQEPANLEVRYLRLASYMFLPFFLKREDSVASDLESLVTGLPRHPEAFSPAVYRAVIQFVLDNGGLDEADRDRLEEAIRSEAPVRTQTDQSVISDG